MSRQLRSLRQRLRYRLLGPLRRVREAMRAREFRAVPRIAIDTRALGVLDATRLKELLAPSAVAAEWTEDQATLAALGLQDVMGGAVNPGDRRALHALVLGLRPRSILEVGTHVGCSTVSLALAARRVGARIVTCDIIDFNDERGKPWRQYGARCSPRALLEQAGCGSHVEFEVGDSLTCLNRLRQRFDSIFLDGDHTAGTVYRELAAALQALNSGGYILLHDYYPLGQPLFADYPAITGPFLAVERLRNEGADLTVQPLGSLGWGTRDGTTVTSLAVVARADG